MQLSQKRKIISEYFLHFANLDLILNISKKNMTLIADAFLKLPTRKRWLDKCLKSHVSEDPSTSYIIDGPIHC